MAATEFVGVHKNLHWTRDLGSIGSVDLRIVGRTVRKITALAADTRARDAISSKCLRAQASWLRLIWHLACGRETEAILCLLAARYTR
jgi:hypothetical protein